MRKILIVGAGQSGLQLALGLQSRGYEVTLMSSRTADEIRTGRVMSTQVMFASALQIERDLRLNFWESQTAPIEGIGVSVGGPDATRAIDWMGRPDGYAQSVDQRVKMAGWMETFAQRGGQVVIHGAAVSDLDYFARTYDLVMVAAGKGELVSMFGRDAARSKFDAPQRALSVSYVHGLERRAEHPDLDPLYCNILPGIGELFVMPTLTTSGRADIVFLAGVPGGPFDVFGDVKDPALHLSLTLELMERHTPWEYARATKAELTDANGTLAGRFAPTVRKPIGELPGGGLVLGVADVVVANDPITGQGSNGAAKCAASYLASIVEHGDQEFDGAWMQSAFDRYWHTAQHGVRWTEAMLVPPKQHVVDMLAAGIQHQGIADRFVNAFDDPSDLGHYFFDEQKMAAYLAEVEASASSSVSDN